MPQQQVTYEVSDQDVGDQALIAAFRAGDDEAFDVLARRYVPTLRRICLGLTGGDAHEAEDIAQECWIRLHAALRRDDRALAVRGWLAVVARHLVIDSQRRRRPLPVADLPERATPDISETFDVDPALAKAWGRLPERHREVLHHRELVGLSYDEIAIAMATSAPAVETLLFRARGALRREYRRAGGRLLGCGLFLFGLERLSRGSSASSEAVAHVASCPSCRRALDHMDRVTALLRGAAGEPMSAPAAVPSRWQPLLNQLPRLHEHIGSLVTPLSSIGTPLANGLVAATMALTPGLQFIHHSPARSAPAAAHRVTAVGAGAAVAPTPAPTSSTEPASQHRTGGPTPAPAPTPTGTPRSWWQWPSPQQSSHGWPSPQPSDSSAGVFSWLSKPLLLHPWPHPTSRRSASR